MIKLKYWQLLVIEEVISVIIVVIIIIYSQIFVQPPLSDTLTENENIRNL